MPLALSSSMRLSIAGLTGRRPNFVPFALALASPAFTLSDHAALNFGEHSQHLKHRPPDGVLVSSPC